mgnify:CR=1 FL=1
MNRTWLVLLLALLLCGCQNQQTPKESDGVSVPAIAVTEPTEPVGFYQPDSPVEVFTNGAIQVFQLDGLHCSFSGELPTLVVHNTDQPGCVSQPFTSNLGVHILFYLGDSASGPIELTEDVHDILAYTIMVIIDVPVRPEHSHFIFRQFIETSVHLL